MVEEAGPDAMATRKAPHGGLRSQSPASDEDGRIVARNEYFDRDPRLLAQPHFSLRLKYFCFARPLSPSCNIGAVP
jgi:hypothetical protein